MDVGSIEKKITGRSKAILVVHIYGLPVSMAPILELAKKYGLIVIEDSAEMHGQCYKGAPCGSFGDISTFSFYPNKLVTSGEGGMIVTDDESLAERCRSLRNLCFLPNRRFVHKARLERTDSNVQAAIGVAELERLEEFVARKRRMGDRYNELLSGIAGLQLPLARTHYAENVYWVYGLVLKEGVSFDAEEAMRRLRSLGVGIVPSSGRCTNSRFGKKWAFSAVRATRHPSAWQGADFTSPAESVLETLDRAGLRSRARDHWRDMNFQSKYAEFYDLFYRDKNYAAEAGFVLELAAQAGIKPGRILNLEDQAPAVTLSDGQGRHRGARGRALSRNAGAGT